MTQRIFDVDNEKDMADLWDILPDDIIKLTPSKALNCIYGWYNNCGNVAIYMLKINWHDKTEITRPIPEATEQDIGKICRFWNDKEYSDDVYFGMLTDIRDDESCGKVYLINKEMWCGHARRLTKQEIEELC